MGVIKEWLSRFATGLGLDNTTEMPNLTDHTDDHRTSQILAVRDSIIALEQQSLGAPWFRWNKTDLTQFDSELVGANISAHTIAVEAHAGVNWIAIDATSGAGTDFGDSGVFLPITATPPSGSYAILADFINLTSGNSDQVGALVAVRLADVDNMYIARMNAWTSVVASVNSLKAGTSAQLGPTVAALALTAVDQGSRLALRCRGDGSAVQLHASMNSELQLRDASSPLTATGKAAIGCSTNAAATQVKNIFRNISCYALVA
jgi:hypothetical protein